MPVPKPRTHLLCKLCAKRERVSGGYCAPCQSYYYDIEATSDISFVRQVMAEDIARQAAALELAKKMADNAGRE